MKQINKFKKSSNSVGSNDNFAYDGAGCQLGFSVRSQNFNRFAVHLFDEVKEPSHYSKVFELMLDADDNDLIDIFINSPGGNIEGLSVLLEGIRLTDGTVRAIVIGACHSAASMLALHCHEVIVTDSATSLIHNCSTGFVGKVADMKNYTDFTTKMSTKLIHDTYEGFLTEEEIQDCIRGKELWIDADEFRQRLKNRDEYMELAEELEREEQEKQEKQDKEGSDASKRKTNRKAKS